jgi:hypothetical protein
MTRIYVSDHGSDKNDGLTKQTRRTASSDYRLAGKGSRDAPFLRTSRNHYSVITMCLLKVQHKQTRQHNTLILMVEPGGIEPPTS